MPKEHTAESALDDLNTHLHYLRTNLEPLVISILGKGERDIKGEYPDANLKTRYTPADTLYASNIMVVLWNLVIRFISILKKIRKKQFHSVTLDDIKRDLLFFETVFNDLYNDPRSMEPIVENETSYYVGLGIQSILKILKNDHFSDELKSQLPDNSYLRQSIQHIINDVIKLDERIYAPLRRKLTIFGVKHFKFMESNLPNQEKGLEASKILGNEKMFYQYLNEYLPVKTISYEKACLRDCLIEIKNQEPGQLRLLIELLGKASTKDKLALKKLEDYVYENELQKFELTRDLLAEHINQETDKRSRAIDHVYDLANDVGDKVVQMKKSQAVKSFPMFPNSYTSTTTLIRVLRKTREQIRLACEGCRHTRDSQEYADFAQDLRDRPSLQSKALGIAIASLGVALVVLGALITASGFGAPIGIGVFGVGAGSIAAGVTVAATGAFTVFVNGIDNLRKKIHDQSLCSSMRACHEGLLQVNKYAKAEQARASKAKA